MIIVSVSLDSNTGTPLVPDEIKQRVRNGERISIEILPQVNGFAKNALRHGVAGLNVDGTRIGTGGDYTVHNGGSSGSGTYNFNAGEQQTNPGCEYRTTQGRWPANLILDEAAAALLDEQSGWHRPGERPARTFSEPGSGRTMGKGWHGPDTGIREVVDNGGGASRYFQVIKDDEEQLRFAYVAKASSRERNEGLQGMEKRVINITEGHGLGAINTSKGDGTGIRENRPRANTNPCVKPLSLMRYLCRLTKTPWGGVVLDPFCGSGSTGVAAVLEGRSFIGIDISAEYLPIAEARLAAASAQPFLFEVT